MLKISKRLTVLVPLVAFLIVGFGAPAQAQRLRGGFGIRVAPRWNVNLGVGPFWGPYYPYGYFPYVVDRPTSAVRVDAVPKQAEVFVDGYFAGTAGKVGIAPGGHAITLYLPGYRTLTQDIYVAPGATVKVREKMDRLAAGEVSTMPPAPVRSPQPEVPSDQG